MEISAILIWTNYEFSLPAVSAMDHCCPWIPAGMLFFSGEGHLMDIFDSRQQKFQLLQVNLFDRRELVEFFKPPDKIRGNINNNYALLSYLS
ncbi:MAG: hypothetical protein JEY79_07270 [Pseudodesulfovibrio sp.]|nr:hypothetical protein [Pseudodesulfovibrio sp.]